MQRRFCRALWLTTVLALVIFALPALASFELRGEIEDGVDPASGVYVRFETFGSGTSQVEYTSEDGTTHTTDTYISLDGRHFHLLAEAKPDSTYTYRIHLADWSGNSMTTDEQGFTTPSFVSPSDLLAVRYEQEAQLFWSPTFASAEYILERAISEDGPFEPVATITRPQYMDTGLTSGSAYYYRIVSRDTAGNEAEPSSLIAVGSGSEVAESDHIPAGISLLHTDFSQAKDAGTWQVPFDAALVHDDELGRQVLEVASTSLTYVFAESAVSLPPGTETIIVSSLTRYEDLVIGENPWDAGRIHLTFHDDAGAHITSVGWPELTFWEGTNGWGWYSRLFEVPDEAKEVRLFAGLHSTSGMVRFGEIIVHAVNADGLPL